ncbi:hypothetical protein GN956_G26760 [Arapaima gigas]
MWALARGGGGRCEEADKLRATQAELEKQHDEIQSSQSAALKEKQELEQRLRSLQEQLSTQWRHQQEAAQRHSKTEAENRVLRDSLQEALGEHGRLRRDRLCCSDVGTQPRGGSEEPPVRFVNQARQKWKNMIKSQSPEPLLPREAAALLCFF